MNKSKIEWCDSTWNPVTGCLHNCDYCYARRIANRFKLMDTEDLKEAEEVIQFIYGMESPRDYTITGECVSLNVPVGCEHNEPYPFNFRPTFHRYRLNEPARKTKPQKIFVCSMADLFGDWVPDEWIEEVFKACAAAPQHKYLFLTKNPKRYASFMMSQVIKAPNYWFGTTVTQNVGIDGQDHFTPSDINTFTSIEPLQRPIDFTVCGDKHFKWMSKWVIIGAETGNRKGKVIPKREWVESIVFECHKAGVPVFMKNSLKDLMGDDFIQEWPEGLR